MVAEKDQTTDSSYPAKLEFEVDDFDPVRIEKLKQQQGIDKLETDESLNRIYVQTCLPTSQIHDKVEKELQTLAVLKGLGSAVSDSMQQMDSAVVELFNEETKVRGVVRLVQLDEDKCAIDGAIDGLVANKTHGLFIHEYGDFSEGSLGHKTGGHFNPLGSLEHVKEDGQNDQNKDSDSKKRCHGCLDIDIKVGDKDEQASFRKIDSHLKLWDVIGRSMCVSQIEKNEEKKLACGIVARSSNVFQNVKRICSCSGKTIWEERTQTKKYANNNPNKTGKSRTDFY